MREKISGIKFGRFIKTIVCLFLIFALNSCIYELSEFYDNPVNKNPTPPTISVVQLDLAVDTVYMYGSLSVAFNFRSDIQEIKDAKLLVDNVVVDEVASSSGVFEFQSYPLKDGLHKLTLQVFTKSGTGSIADKLGGENFINSKDWVLVVDKDQSKNLSYAPKDGYLNITWKKCKSSDFVSYLVYRGNWEGELICTTQNLNFIDSSYVGQSSYYSVYVKKKDGSTIDWGSLYLSTKFSSIHLDVNKNNEYYLWWNKNPYSKAINNFTFKLGTTTWQSTNINDTIIKTSLHFNDYCDFTMNVVPKRPAKNYQLELYNYKMGLTDRVGINVNITSYWYTPITQISKDIVACYYNDSIQKFQLSTLKFISKQALRYNGNSLYGTTLSPNGKFIIGGIGSSNYVAINLETNQSYVFNDTGNYISISQTLYISDVGTGIIIGYNGFENAFESVYDYVHKQGYRYHSSKNIADKTLISPDGQFYITDGYGYSKNNNSSNYIFYVSGRFEFFPDDSNKLMVLNNSKITIYQCYPFTKLRAFDVPDIVYNIDYFNNEILCGSTKMLIIRSLVDGSVIKEIPMTNTPQYFENYYLYNHVIVSENQYAYQVK